MLPRWLICRRQPTTLVQHMANRLVYLYRILRSDYSSVPICSMVMTAQIRDYLCICRLNLDFVFVFVFWVEISASPLCRDKLDSHAFFSQKLCTHTLSQKRRLPCVCVQQPSRSPLAQVKPALRCSVRAQDEIEEGRMRSARGYLARISPLTGLPTES